MGKTDKNGGLATIEVDDKRKITQKAYIGDAEHGKYWRSLQSAKPIRFVK